MLDTLSHTKPSPKLIGLEGLDGSGKTTLANELIKQSEEQGLRAVNIPTFYRPSEDRIWSAYRLIKEKGFIEGETDQLIHTMMFAGVCLDGIDRVKREQSCDVVIFDRYVLSRFALGRWQKEGRISPAEQVITSMVREDYLPTPDTTAFLRIDPRIALSRILAERGNQPLENKESFSSLEEVAEIYDDIITCPKINSVLPVTVIDATDPPDIIAKSILSDLR